MTRHRFFLIACCWLACLGLSSVSGLVQAAEYVNKEHGFALTFPEGWKKSDDETPGVIVRYDDPTDDSELSVQTEIMPLEFASKDYAKSLRQGIEEVLNGKITEAPSRLKVGGQPAWRFAYEYFGMRQMTCQVVKGDVCLAICVVYGDKEKSEKRLKKDIDEVLKSFRFIKAK